MSFREKISNFLDNYTLRYIKKYPRNRLYIYADYLELLALFSTSNYVSGSDLLDRLEENLVVDNRFLRNLTYEESVEYSADDEDGSNEYSEDSNQEDNDEDRAEVNDLKEIFINSILDIVEKRALIFGADYPFSIEDRRIKIKEFDELENKNKIYIFLLVCSSLDIFKDFMPTVTKEFELISYNSLLNFLPSHSIVKSFGKNSDYVGNARTKIEALANDMNIEIEHTSFNQVSPANFQEKGLDIIGWIPFSDQIPNMICILGQVTCEKDWTRKLSEAGRYKNYLKFHKLDPITALFIPYNLTHVTEKCFIRNDDLINSLLFERKRIIDGLSNTDFYENLDSKFLVESLIDYLEPIV